MKYKHLIRIIVLNIFVYFPYVLLNIMCSIMNQKK